MTTEQLTTAAATAELLTDQIRELYSGAESVALDIVLTDLLRQSVAVRDVLRRLRDELRRLRDEAKRSAEA